MACFCRLSAVKQLHKSISAIFIGMLVPLNNQKLFLNLIFILLCTHIYISHGVVKNNCKDVCDYSMLLIIELKVV